MKIKFKNKLSTETVRVRIVSSSANTIIPSVNESNPTVLVEAETLTFCLAPKEESLSCIGATKEATVSFNTNNEYLIKLNGQVEYKGKISVNASGEVSPVSPNFQYITIQAIMYVGSGFEVWSQLKFTNISQSETYRLEIISYPEDRRDPPDPNNPLDAIASFQSIAQSNSAIFYKDGMPSESSTGEPVIAYKSVAFCLNTEETLRCELQPSYVVLDSGDPFREVTQPYVLTVNGVNYPNEEDTIYYYAINNNNPTELNGIFSMYVDSSGGSLYLQNRSDTCLYISDTEGLSVVLGVNSNE